MQDHGRPKDHGHVPVMAAGMHRVGMFRGKGEACVFDHRQCVKFAAQHQGLSRLGKAMDSHYAGARDAGCYLHREPIKLLGNKGRGFLLGKSRLRDLVQFTAQPDNVLFPAMDGVL